MKRCLFILLILGVFKTYAQVSSTPSPEPLKTLYGTIEYTTPFYNLEDRWAVLPKNAQINKYLFGMIYVDNTAGYTFRLEGFFQVDEQGHVFRDSTDYVKNNNVTVARVGAGTKMLGAIPDAMLPILKVKPVPEWLAIYHPATLNRDAAAYKITRGRFLNALRECAKALEFLEPVYKTDPHAIGLEYELSYAYNVLGRSADAITILKGAIAATPDNGSLYAELGYAYIQNKDYTTAADVFLKGLDLAKKKNDVFFRNSMTTNLTLVYTELKQYDKAVGIVNQFLADSPNNMSLHILLASIYFKADDFENAAKAYIKAIELANPADMQGKAQMAYTLATLYRDKLKNTDQYTLWGKRAKEWAPANTAVAKAANALVF